MGMFKGDEAEGIGKDKEKVFGVVNLSLS